MYRAVFWNKNKDDDKSPKPSITKLIKLRDKMLQDISVVAIQGENVFSSSVLDQLAVCLSSHCPSTVRSRRIRESIDCLRGQTLTEAGLKLLCWRIAAGVPELSLDRAILCQGDPTFESWQAFKIDSIYQSYKRKDKLSYRLELLLLTGPGAGSSVQIYLTNAAVRYLAYSSVFVYRKREFEFYDVKLLTGMYVYGFFEPSDSDTLLLTTFCQTGKTKEYNRIIFKGRDPELRTCNRSENCADCSCGRDSCPFAVRKLTLTQGYCKECLKSPVMIDPYVGSYCSKCTRELEIL